MNVVQFTAEDAPTALAQVHDKLGPDAVVVKVRSLPAHGLTRFLPRRRRIEVLAGVPESGGPDISSARLEDSELRAEPEFSAPTASRTANRWPSVAWLEAMGLLPIFADHLQTRLKALHADNPPDTIEAEWIAVSGVLAAAWRPPPPLEEERRPARPHVFVGPPGSGKTTALCKWLALAVLTQERTARVWRLDSAAANTSELLSLHAETLGVPVERFWSGPDARADLQFVDLPGADPDDSAGMTALRNQLAALPGPRVHLVLNAAYETEVLLAQCRAFEPLRPEDVILTHLDEERRRVKLWNLVWGTNCTVRFVSAGQKIPGAFRAASPEHFLPAENRR